MMRVSWSKKTCLMHHTLSKIFSVKNYALYFIKLPVLENITRMFFFVKFDVSKYLVEVA